MAAVRLLAFAKIHIGHVFCIVVRFCISGPNFALIGQYGAEI